MSQWTYVAASWLIVAGTITAYITRVILRGKKLSRIVPPEEQRWM